jgi:hypothetical protein
LNRFNLVLQLYASPSAMTLPQETEEKRASMSRYRVRVQLITWYEIAVNAQSAGDAYARAETLRPNAIRTRGKQISEVTGLADPFSLQPINGSDFHQANGTPGSLSTPHEGEPDES